MSDDEWQTVGAKESKKPRKKAPKAPKQSAAPGKAAAAQTEPMSLAVRMALQNKHVQQPNANGGVSVAWAWVCHDVVLSHKPMPSLQVCMMLSPR